MINAILGSFLTIYFTNVALLDAGIIASIVAVSKLLDGVSDLIVGNIVDWTKSKMGKVRVWLARICIPFAVTTVLLFFVPTGFPTMLKYVYVFLMYNIVNAVGLTFMLVPYYSMISLVTANSYERGMLGNIQQIFQTLGNIVVNTFFVAMLTKFSSSAENIYMQQAFTITMIIFGIIVVAASMICIVCTKERVNESVAQKKEKDDVNPIVAFKALIMNRYWVTLTIAMFVVFFCIIMYAVGDHFIAGEFSYMLSDYDRDYTRDSCMAENTGIASLMDYVSEETGIPAGELDGIRVFSMANQGDEKALAGLKKYVRHLAVHIHNCRCMFDPECIAVGGGISVQPLFLQMIREELQKLNEVLPWKLSPPHVVTCRFFNDANLLGAVYVHLRSKEKRLSMEKMNELMRLIGKRREGGYLRELLME